MCRIFIIHTVNNFRNNKYSLPLMKHQAHTFVCVRRAHRMWSLLFDEKYTVAWSIELVVSIFTCTSSPFHKRLYPSGNNQIQSV